MVVRSYWKAAVVFACALFVAAFVLPALAAAPTVTDITPNNGPTAGGTNVTITGTNFVAGSATLFGAKTDYTAGTGPRSVATADFNGDGKLDLAASNEITNNVSVYIGTGTGTFGPKVDFPVGASPEAITTADFNGDGKSDLAAANWSTNNISILLGTGTGTFGAKVDYASGAGLYGITTTDFNGDGKFDIATANDTSGNVSVLLGTGTGTFGTKVDYATGVNPRSVTTGDFNGDAKPDLAVGNNSANTVSILLGTGTGTFGAKTDYAVGTNPWSVATGDFNGDGKLDLATANMATNNVSILLGTGTGTFGAKTDYSVGSGPISVKIVDFNGDGKLDLATANYTSGNVSVLLGTGAGAFGAKTDYTTGTNSSNINIGDFSGDGKSDIVTTNRNANNLSILLNTFGAPLNVTFGGVSATNINFVNSNTLTGTTPSHAVGAVDVVVTNGDGTTGTLTGGYTYNAPPGSFTLVPSSVLKTGGDSITITGSNFGSGATVTFGGVAGTVTFVNSTTLSVVTPVQNAGIFDVVVTNPDGGSATLAGGITFTDPPPGISSIDPTSGSIVGGTNVTITGTNFTAGDDANTKLLLHAEGANNSITIIDSETVPKTVTANGNARVSTSQSKFGASGIYFDGTGDYLSVPSSPDWDFGTGDFTIDYWVYPTALRDYDTHLSGNQSDTGWVIHVNAAGKMTLDAGGIVVVGSGTRTIAINQWNHVALVRSGNNFNFYINGLPGTAPATYAISCNSNGLGITIGGRYRVNVDNYYSTGYIDEVRISKGIARWTSSFTPPVNAFAGPTQISFGGSSLANVQVVNSTTITGTTPAHTAGAVDVVATNPDGTSGTLTGGYTYIPPPGSFTITPSSVLKTGGDSITITGSNFGSGATVTFGGVAAQSVTFVNSTTLSVVTPVQNAGIFDVVVTNPDGQSLTLTNGITFTNLPPGSFSITPNTGSTAGGTNVTITGSNFTTGSPTLFGAKTDYAAGINPYDVTTGDWNGDDKLDLAVANIATNNVSVYLGTGTGTFGAKTDYAVGVNVYGIANGDFNGDGKLDLVTANYAANTASVLLGTGTGTFGAKTDFAVGAGPWSVNAADFNGDGKLDLVTMNITSNNVSVLLGTGTGTFGAKVDYPVGTGARRSVIKDFNGDGKLDVAVANYGTNNVSVLLGTGTGTFGTKTDFAAGTGSQSVTAGDFNKDGKLDLAVANYGTNNVSVLLGTGTGTFGTKTDYAVGSGAVMVAAVDWSEDGNLDLITTNTIGNTVSVILGTGTGSFGAKTDYISGASPVGMTTGDFNKDGRLDIVTANYVDNNASVLLNTFGSPLNLTFGGVVATNINFVNSTTITATTLPHSAGAVDAVVTNSDGQSTTLTNGFTYIAPGTPSVSAITPNNGVTLGGTNVTITGTNFVAGAPALATGGTVTTSGLYTIHTFPSGGTFTVPSSGLNSVEVLVVGGGGGGGQTIGGGGGGGGVIYNTAYSVTPNQAIPVTVGAGGAGAPGSCASYGTGGGTQGSNSVFGSLTAIAGGGGGNFNQTSDGSTSGGSGGGQGGYSVGAGKPGTAGQGNAGGATSANFNSGAGGGGAGGAGANGVSGTPGVGGAGVANSISGTSLYYAGGGGGGARNPGGGTGGAGGSGTGGAGGTGASAGTAGTTNRGGGGGGGGFSDATTFCGGGGSGGSGIVIVRYLPQINLTIGGVTATSAQLLNSTTIIATTPAHAAGAADVVVTNGDGQSATLTGGYTYAVPPPPGISSINPANGPVVGGTNVTITGTNFVNNVADASTKLLLHFDNNFLDSSFGTPKTATVNGATSVPAQYKYGGYSGFFGSATYATVPSSADFEFGGDYTVDTWIYPTASPPSATAGDIVNYGNHTAGQVFWDLVMLPDDTIRLNLYNGASYVYALTSSQPVTLNAWSHIAAVRSGNNVYLFINGTQVATASYAGSLVPTGQTLFIGRHAVSTTNFFRGYIDEFRISKGVARWTANFTPPTSSYGQPNVTLGGAVANNIIYVNSTSITATTPAHTAGATDVVVTNPDSQTGTLTGGYTYVPPPGSFTVTPSSVLKTGGNTITITGSNFISGANVTFGGVAGTVTFVNSSTLSVVTPVQNAGTFDVVVTNPDGQSATLTNGITFTDLPPGTFSIAPNTGTTLGGTHVTITGSNFLPKNTGGDVGWTTVAGKTLPGVRRGAQQAVIGNNIYLFGGYSTVATNSIYVASTSDPTTWTDTGKTLPGALAFSQVAIVGDYIYLFGGYNGSAAAVKVIYRASVSDPTTWTDTGKVLPGNVYGGQVAVVGNDVYLFGGYNGASYLNTIYRASTADPTTWINTGKTLPSVLAYSSVVIIGTSMYLYGGTNASAVTSVIYSASTADPTTWVNTGKTVPALFSWQQVAVVGDYIYFFGRYNGTTAVSTIYQASITDPTTVVVTGSFLPVALSHSHMAVVDGYVYLFGGYLASGANTSAIYRAPLSHFRPNVYNPFWKTNWGTIVSDQSNVTIGGVSATNINFASSTSILATTPAHTEGAMDVVVTNYDGANTTLTNGFTYIAPEAPLVSTVVPNSGSTAGGTNVIITGTNFVGAFATWNPADKNANITLSGGNLMASKVGSTLHSVARANVGKSSGKWYWEVTLTGVTGGNSPGIGVGNATMSLANSRYLGDDANGWGWYPALGTKIYNGAQTAYAAGVQGNVIGVALDMDAGTLTYYKNGVSQGQAFSGLTGTLYPVVNLYQTSDIATANFGATAFAYTPPWGFSAPISNTGGATFGGVPATNVVVVNGTTITATTPAHSAGATDVVVTNPDAQTGTLTNSYTYVLPPTITSLTPTSVLKTGGNAITITGSNFISGATVSFGGVAAQSVSFVNSTTLNVTTPVQNTGTFNVVVTNPDGQTATLANGITFTELPPGTFTITPDSGSTAGGTNVTITGTNFQPQNTGGDTGWAVVAGKTLPASVSQYYSAVIGGYVYIYGGYNQATAAWTNNIYRAPVSDPTTWTNTGKVLPGVVGGAGNGLAVIGDYVYIFDGNQTVGGASIYRAPVSDPTTWTNTGKTIPSIAIVNQTAVIGSKVYVFGGWLSGSTYTGKILSANISDPTTWTDTGKTLPGTTYLSQFVVTGSELYMIGGTNGTGSSAIWRSTTADPTTWVNTGKTFPVTIGYGAQAVIGDYAYIFGGAPSGSYSNKIWRAPLSDLTSWTDTGSVMPATWALGNAMLLGNYVYVFGGYNGSLRTNIIHRAPLQHFRQNLYNNPFQTDWGTLATDQTGVTLGGVPATNIQVVNSTTVTANTPAHTAGATDVVVTNSDGQSTTLTNGFTYFPPSITSVTPNSGSTAGGTNVTITGSNFQPKDTGGDTGWVTVAGKTLPSQLFMAQQAVIGNTIYLFGGNNGTGYTNTIYSASTADPTTWVNTGKTLPGILSHSQLAVIGGYIYFFGGYNGTTAVSTIYRATVADPTTWTLVAGKTLPAALYGSQIAIVGDNIYLYGGYNGTAYTNVIYSASVADPTTWVNTGKTLPGVTYGAQLITIGNDIYMYGGYNGSWHNLIYKSSTADPTTWVNTGKTLPVVNGLSHIAVVGDYIYFLGGYSGVPFNTIYRAPISDPTTWTNTGATLPANLTMSHMAIIDGYMYLFGGQTVAGSTGTNAIYRAPLQHFRLNLYNPSWKTNWTTVASDLSNLTFGGVVATNINFVNSTTITATTPAHSAGAVDAVVTNSDGQTATLAGGYTYNPSPGALSVVPSTVLKTGGNTVTVTGSNFVSGATVTFGGVTATSVSFINSTTLAAVTPVQNAGTYDVIITNPDGQSTKLTRGITFTDLPPGAFSISPNTGPSAGGTSVTITGSNFVEGNTTLFAAKTDYTAGTGPRSVAIADFNGDGKLDLAVSNEITNNASVFLGTGTGTFGVKTDFPAGTAPQSITTGDFNSDGKPDLAVANWTSNNLSVLLGTGAGAFGAKTDYLAGTNPNSVTTGDFNGDGKLDLAAANYASNNVSVLLGTGTGTFGTKVDYATGNGAFSVAPGDFNGDGKLDLATANNSAPAAVSVLLGTGTGTFGAKADYTVGIQPVGITAGDFNGDGKLDLATSNYSANSTSIILGTGTGAFGTKTDYATGVNPRTLTTHDLNGDGKLDLVTTNQTGNTVSVLLGTGTGTFGTKTDLTVGTAPFSSAIGDFNGDNKPDIAVANNGTNNFSILLNTFRAPLNVTFGGTALTNIQVVNSTTITATTPAHALGAVDAVVINSDGASTALINGFTYLSPSIISITPNSGPVAGGTNVTITGANLAPAQPGSGGIVTTSNGYYIHTFTSSGTFTPPPGVTSVQVLAVGGGGQGGRNGGGGAGGLLYNPSLDITNQPYAVTVGNGGNSYVSEQGANGGDSSFSTLTAIGGGGGAGRDAGGAGKSGGSGGGGGGAYGQPRLSPGSGTAGQGYAGGNGAGDNGCSSSGGGGGGAGGVGTNAASGAAGNGGIGVSNSISGSAVYYAGGGGGNMVCPGSGSEGIGGIGGGGTYGISNAGANTGGGGAGGPYAGGSGVVIVRYLMPFNIKFDGVSVTNVNFINSTTVTATTPPHVAGLVDVVLENPDGANATLTNGYTYGADRLAIITNPLNQREGQPGMISIQSQDLAGNVVAVATTTIVQLSSTAPTGFFARDLAEDPATRWNYNSVIIPAGESSVNFYYMDNLKGTPTVSISAPGVPTGDSQQETIVSKYRFLVTGITNPVRQGVPSSVTFQAVDYDGVPLHDYTGTVRFTSTDGQAVMPSDFAVTPPMLGGFTFVNGITMLTQGTWCVAMTDTSDSNIIGSQCGIVVSTPAVGTPTQLKFITSPQFVPVTGTSTPITVQILNTDDLPVSSTATTTVYIYTDSATALFSKNGTTGWAGAPLVLEIKPGLTSVNFYYRDSTLGAHTITASDDATQGVDFGLTNDSQTETVTTGGVSTVGVLAATHSMQAGATTTVAVTLKDLAGNIVASQINQPIFVRASGSAQVATNADGPWSSVVSTTINVGQTGLMIYARDVIAETFTVTASDFDPANGATGLIDGVDSIVVSAGPATAFTFSTPAYQVTAGAVSGVMTLRMTDQFGNLATAGTTTSVYLYSDQAGGLFSANPGFTPLETSAIIAAGQSSISVYFKQSTYLDAPVTITASDNSAFPDGGAGIIDATQIETIVPGAVFRFVITNTPPITGIVGDAIPITIAAQNSYGLAIPFSGATTVYLRTNSSSPLHEFSILSASWSPVTSLNIPLGATSTTLYYKDTGAGAPTVTFADEPVPGPDTGILNATSEVSIAATDADTLSITSTAFSIQAGQVSPAITVRLQDQYGNAIAATTSLPVALSSTGVGGGFGTTTTGTFTATNIVIPSGQTSATFYYKDMSAGTPMITASASGFVSASQQETVNWGTATALRLSVASSTTAAGVAAGPIRAYLVNSSGANVPALSNFTVNLSSSASATGAFDTSAVGAFDKSITSVIIAQNATSTDFFYEDTRSGSANITAAGSGVTSAVLTMTVASAAAVRLGFTPVAGQTLEIGQKSATSSVSLYDQFGNIVTAATSTPIALTTDSGQGTFLSGSNQTINQVLIPAGQSGASFSYRDLSTGSSILTAHTDSLTDAILTETIVYGVPTSIILSASSTSLTAGVASDPITISLRNSSGQSVPAQGATAISLSSSALTGRFDTSSGGVFDGSVTSVTIPDGQFSSLFYYLDTLAGSPTVTGSKSGLVSGTIGLNATAAVPSQIVFINTPRTTAAGAASAVFTAQFRDSLGNVKVLTAPVTLELASQATSTGGFATSASGPWTATSIVISAGASSGNFYYRDTLSGTKAIAISSTGLTGASQNTTIIGAVLNHFKFMTPPRSMSVLEPSAVMTIGAFDAYENVTAPVANLTILLTSTSTQHQFSVATTTWTSVTSAIFPIGQSTLNFYYKDWHPGTPVVTARNQAGTYPAISQAETVTSGDASALLFSTIAQTVVVGTPSGQVGIRLLDSAGNQVFATVPLTVNVSGNSPTAVFTDDYLVNPWQTTLPVSFAPGDSIKYFYFKDSAEGTLQISLAASGFTGATQNETMVLGTPVQIAMVSAATIPAGQPALVTLESRTAGGLPVAVQSPVTVPLSDNLGGQFSLTSSPWTPITSITIPAGNSQKTFYFRSTVAGTHTITANGNGAGLGSATNNIDVLALNVYRLSVLSGPVVSAVNQPSTAFTVQTQDQYGNAVPINITDTGGAASVDVYLYGTGQFALSEVGPWGIPSVTMLLGDNTFTIYYRSPTPGAQTITVSDQGSNPVPDTGWLNGTWAMNVTGDTSTKVIFLNSPQTVTAGTRALITIEANKSDDLPAVLGTPLVVTLGANWIGGQFSLSSATTSSPITQVTIPVGQSSASFYAYSNLAGTYSISLAAPGHTGAAQPFIVQSGPPEKLVFLSAPQSIGAGNDSTVMRIAIQDQLGNIAVSSIDTPVDLAATDGGQFSTDPAATWLAVTRITIPAGSSDAYFYFRNASISGAYQLSVSDASAQGFSSAIQNVTVTAGNVNRLRIVSTPFTVMKGQISPAITLVFLDQFGNTTSLAEPLAVYLYSTSPSGSFSSNEAFSATTTVLSVPEGLSSAAFYYRDGTSGAPVITVSDHTPPDLPDIGLQNDAQTETVNEGSPYRIRFIDAPTAIMAGGARAFIAELQNQYGEPVAPTLSSLTMYLYSTSLFGRFSLSNSFQPADFINNLQFNPGETMKTFYYRDTIAGTQTITASDQTPLDLPDIGLGNAERAQSILSASVYSLNFLNAPQALETGDISSALTIGLRDQFGNSVVASSSIALYLYTDSAQGGFATSSSASVFTLAQAAFPTGASAFTLYYKDLAVGTPKLTVSDATPLDAPDIGIVNAVQTQSITVGNIFRIAFTSPPQALEMGEISQKVTVEFQNSHGAPRPVTSNTPIYLSSSNAQGQFSLSPSGPWTIMSVTVLSGQASADLYYRQLSQGGATLTASDGTPPNGPIGLIDGTQSIGVSTGVASQIVISAPTSVISRHPSSPITITVQNSHGVAASSSIMTRLYIRSSITDETDEFAKNATGPWGINYVDLPAGQTQIPIYFRGVSNGTRTISVSDELPAVPGVGLTNANVLVEIVPQTMDHLLVTNISDPQIQGQASSIIVQPQDAEDYLFVDYAGTICFSASDADAVIPPCYTFDPSVDKGIHTFGNGVAFLSAGEKFVRADDSVGGYTGRQNNITVVGNTAGSLAKLKFVNPPAEPAPVPKNLPYGPVTIGLFDLNDQTVNAPVGGYQVFLTSDSATALFSSSPSGPWTSQLIVTIPTGLSSINFYYKDGRSGTFTVSGKDWVGAQNNPLIQDASFVVQMSGLRVEATTAFFARDSAKLGLIPNEILFSNDVNTAIAEGSATFSLAAKDEITGAITPVTWDFVFKDVHGNIKDQRTVASAGTYNLTEYPIQFNVPIDSGDWPLDIVVTAADGRTGSLVIPVPISFWRADIQYDVGYVQLGTPIPVTVSFLNNGASGVPADFTLTWLDIGSNVIGSAPTLSKAQMIEGPPGEFHAEMATAALIAGEQYHMMLSGVDGSGTILAQSAHADIQIVNNPALAPKNFTVTKIVTSVPPAPETYDLKFTWDDSENATSYQIYATTDKFMRLYDDPCTIAQVQSGARAANTCETTINMQTVGNDEIISWIRIGPRISDLTGSFSYTLNNAEDQLYWDDYFFILRANNGLIESGLSSMLFVSKHRFNFNSATNATNYNWFSIPYSPTYITNPTGGLSKATIDYPNVIVRDIEGNTGLNKNQKIATISLWDSATQNINSIYRYRTSPFNKWTGIDFPISPGDGIYIQPSGTVPSFDWTVLGSDKKVVHNFSYNQGSSVTNYNWISLPYSGMYRTASDIVQDIEGSLGVDADTKINSLALWDSATQNINSIYRYRPAPFNKWSGIDFEIKPGDGVYLQLSPDAPPFDWTPALIVEPND